MFRFQLHLLSFCQRKVTGLAFLNLCLCSALAATADDDPRGMSAAPSHLLSCTDLHKPTVRDGNGVLYVGWICLRSAHHILLAVGDLLHIRFLLWLRSSSLSV